MLFSNRSEKEIFGEAIEFTSPEAQVAFVRGACGKDQELLKRVESLLKLHGGAGNFLEGDKPAASPSGEHASLNSTPSEGPGSIIGRYRLLQKIGEGGFGVVYMAEQREPVKRRVALKIIKLGMDTRQVVGRFEAERQALAMMDHPNIAKVYDGGATETGRPYFVMELVRGVPLTEFCDDHHLTPKERLDLFMQICSAIQHAHQKGVIHRDLKPSNVLITMHDDRAVPKVIDFGIAKATQQDLTDKTVFTRFHEFLGTPAYMSPEQAQLSGLDIDTRSDIYALGVLLYELLTGQTPFDSRELISSGYDEMRRRIREEEPLKPSTRLKTLSQEDRTHVARRRQSDPAQLGSLVKGDLDWIVMKAIEKNRSRRYDSAGALAEDIRRFLSDEPVTAAAPTLAYRSRKFARRHRTALAMAILLMVLLASGALISTYYAIRAKRAEVVARQQAAIAEAVNHFLNEDLFAQADPQVQPDRELRLKTALDRATQQIGGRFRDQPLVEAEIRANIGRAYRNLGEYDSAEPNLRLAFELRFHELGERHPDTIRALGDLALVEGSRDNKEMAVATGEKALNLAVETLGQNDPLTFQAMSYLSWIYYTSGINSNALALAAKAVALAPDIPGVEPEDHAKALHVLGRMLGKRNQVVEGEAHLRKACQLMVSAFGESHPFTLYSKHFLAAYLYDHRLKLDEVEGIYCETLAQWRRIYGETHEKPLMVRRNLVYLYIVQERFTEAAHHLLRLLEFWPADRQEGDLERLRRLMEKLPSEVMAGAARLNSEAWLASETPPLSTWPEPDFPDEDWHSLETITKPEQWLRQVFYLDRIPAERPVILIRDTGDFEVLINGAPARRAPYGKLDHFQVVICDRTAQNALHAGPNLIAIHGKNLNPAESIDVQLWKIPNLVSPSQSASTR